MNYPGSLPSHSVLGHGVMKRYGMVVLKIKGLKIKGLNGSRGMRMLPVGVRGCYP